MPFAAATSSHPVTAHATGEVLGQILEALGRHPDVVLLSASAGHAGALDDVSGAIDHVLSPTVTGGAVADHPGPVLSLWAATIGPVAPWRLTDRSAGIPELPGGAQGMVVLTSPDAAIEGWLEAMAGVHPEIPIFGLVTSGRGGSTLLLDGRRHFDGAVGVVIGPGCPLGGRVVPLGRPIGAAMVLTRFSGRLVHELDGIPALERLRRLARDEVPAADIQLINQGLHLGSSAIDPFPLHAVIGADRANGTIALDGEPTGPAAQFFVRDRHYGYERWQAAAPNAAAALVFVDGVFVDGVFDGVFVDGISVDGGHESLADGDARSWSRLAWIGWQGAGVIGPVTGRSGRHPLAASMAVFGEMNSS